jgi:membrane-bound metal-dependent hydrolase YbcI (DUF457 family)
VDNLTHSLFALTLARTPLARAGKGTTAALLVASNIPDIDIVTAARGSVSYLHWHRGPTHGPLGIVGLGLATAGLVWLWERARAGRTGKQRSAPASLGMLAAMSIVAVLLHVLMDLPTSYGTRVLSPFAWTWFAMDWMPIIDVYLLIALAAGLLFGTMSPASRRRNAAIVLAVMAANYGMRAAAHHEALVLAPRLFGPLLPPRCGAAHTQGIVDTWPQPADAAVNTTSATRCLVEMAAIPTFVSPFRWRLIAHLSNAYEIHEINLLEARFRSPAAASEALWRLTLRFPNVWTPAVAKAADSRVGRVYLGFSRFPSARAFTDPAGGATVRWSDMRFVGGLLALDRPARRPDPFTAVVRIGADGRIASETLGR